MRVVEVGSGPELEPCACHFYGPEYGGLVGEMAKDGVGFMTAVRAKTVFGGGEIGPVRSNGRDERSAEEGRRARRRGKLLGQSQGGEKE